MNNITKKKIPAFKDWLVNQGAEILPLTSEWEVLRFKAAAGVGIVHRNKKERMNPSNDMVVEAYGCFIHGKKWDKKAKPNRRANGSKSKRALLNRDGDLCFYCLVELTDENISEEHLLSLIHGGNNRLENKVLACKPCNKKAGNKSLKDKFEMALKSREKRNGLCPCGAYSYDGLCDQCEDEMSKQPLRSIDC